MLLPSESELISRSETGCKRAGNSASRATSTSRTAAGVNHKQVPDPSSQCVTAAKARIAT
jgi:hypothetical protein